MRTYSLDIDPEQLVFWIREELAQRPARFGVSASCRVETGSFDKRSAANFGDAEAEDLHEVAIAAVLEITPRKSEAGWSIAVFVEDESGMGLSDEGSESAEDEIGLEAFYDMFLRTGRGTVFVTASVENAQAQAQVTRLLGEVTKDLHHGRSSNHWK